MLQLIAAAGLLLASQADELAASRVDRLPAVGGRADDEAWKAAKELSLGIDLPGEDALRKKISLKAVHDGTSISLLIVWSDPDRSGDHTPFRLNGDVYEEDGEKLEDGCVVAFALDGKFDSDMKAGVESSWDVWEWGAARTPDGFARDRRHVYSFAKPEGMPSRRLTTRGGGPNFFSRPDDARTPADVQVLAPETKGPPQVLQHRPQAPAGSAADGRAKGEWAAGAWTLELQRRLDTGHQDDAVLAPGKTVEFALATFDKSEKGDHEVTRTVALRILEK